MSDWDKSYEERREERREKERRYSGDVVYEVWRAGGNSDHVDREQTNDDMRDGMTSGESATHELHRQRPTPELPSEEEFFEEQEP